MELQQFSPAEMFDRYFGPALFTPWAEVLLDHAAPKPGEAVLDLACGTGTVARHLGVPLSSEMASPWSFPAGKELRALLAEAGFQRVDRSAF